jgi:3'-phosphoadenosine 5'-phosphosulfate (PAPS) 3'-phosphatase
MATPKKKPNKKAANAAAQSTVKTDGIDDVRKACQEMGDMLKETYVDTRDLKAAQTSIKAYSTAINAAKTQVIYKKLTGHPPEIPFLKS